VETVADNQTGDTDRTSANTDESHMTAADPDAVEPPRGARRGPSRTQAVYVISVAAELAGMHPQTLRIYERRGLVRPARTKGGNRRYSDADIAILHRIAELTDAGMNLEGIRRIMALEVEIHRLRAELEQAREIALHAISEADRRQSGGDLVPVRQPLAVYGRRP